MADENLVKILKQGSEVWNKWREEHPEITSPDLSGAVLNRVELDSCNLGGSDLNMAELDGASLKNAYLYNANLNGARLNGANLSACYLYRAELSGAHLEGANLKAATLTEANLNDADLSEANLYSALVDNASLIKADLSYANLNFTNLNGSNLSDAYLRGANISNTNLAFSNLSRANLQQAVLIKTTIEGATISDCYIYGLSVWDLVGTPKEQSNLIITEGPTKLNIPQDNKSESKITVDDLQVAQFIYFMLENKNIRTILDSIASKSVLILGRFTNERKIILDAIRESLRTKNYLSILFDFEGPQSRNLTETVSTLAHMAKFVIAYITDAKSIPQELMAIVPHLPSLPIQPLLLATEKEYAMFKDYRPYPWMLKTCYYSDINDLLSSLQEKVIQPAEDYLATHRS